MELPPIAHTFWLRRDPLKHTVYPDALEPINRTWWPESVHLPAISLNFEEEPPEDHDFRHAYKHLVAALSYDGNIHSLVLTGGVQLLDDRTKEVIVEVYLPMTFYK